MEQQAPFDVEAALRLQVDSASLQWRQGDVVQGLSSIRLADLNRPLTSAADEIRKLEGLSSHVSAEVTPGELGIVDVEAFDGHAIISQTCDVVRACSIQKYIQIAPVVRLENASAISAAKKWRALHSLWLPGLQDDLFADLNESFTVEKSVLVGRVPIRGLLTDDHVREFSAVVARRYGRFAFPDNFHDATKRLGGRIKDKHDKNTLEGRVLRALYQIRAQAFPYWDADRVEIVLHFILEPGSEFESGESFSSDLLSTVNGWADLCSPCGEFSTFTVEVSTLNEFTLNQYRLSEVLDLDYLSRSIDS